MKSIFQIIFLLVVSFSAFSQIDVSGDAYYQADVLGYMDRRSKGCGDVDGLKHIKIFNGSTHTLFNGREIYYKFDESYIYTKRDPINKVEIKITERWKTDIGTCDKGPNDRYFRFENLSNCYTNPNSPEAFGYGLSNVTVTNRPIVKLNVPNNPLYLGDRDVFKITLPDNLSTNHYTWKFKVGNEPEKTIPNAFNGSGILDIKGVDFLNERDFGKNVAVWLEMGCDAGEKYAEGKVRRDAFVKVLSECRDLTNFNAIRECLRTFGDTVENYVQEELTPEFIAQYQSKRSNPVVFRYLKTAPTIFDVKTEMVSCRNSSDGVVKLIFNNNLSPQEKFSFITLKRGDIEITQLDINTLNPEPNNKWSYTFPDEIPSGIYDVKLLGVYKGNNTYTDSPGHTFTFEVERPTAVQFDITESIDSRCNDGDPNPGNNNDGEILISASGGNPGIYRFSYQFNSEPYSDWEDFNQTSQHRMTGLQPGEYKIKVKKEVRNRLKECIAYELNGSGEPTSLVKIVPITITEPDEILQLEYTALTEPSVNEPRAFGFEDGRISARIFGGSKFVDGTYRYEWKNSSGEILASINTEVLPGDQGFMINLHSVGAGTYSLSVWDSKYDEATFKTGCFMINSEYTLSQPDPLTVDIEILNTISCNKENEYSNGADFEQPLGQPDQFQDGALIATVSGGVPFDTTTFPQANDCRENRTEYCYFWKKQNPDGSWSSVGNNDRIIRNRSTGTFALNIEDYNGIQLGTYEPYQLPDGSREYRLQTAIDSTQFLDQPDKLEVDFAKTSISCANGNDAMAEALVVGGTPPYTYRWSTGADTKTANDLIAGTYLVYIEDAKGCQLEGSVTIEQPNGLEIIPVDLIAPTCYQGNDGVVNVQITGGTPPYEYEWSTGETALSRNNLSAGTYRIQVGDAEGCLAFKDFILEDPLPVFVNLEATRSLCGGQSVILDITIEDPNASYQWEASNDFKSSLSKVELNESGVYTATITSGLGCIGTSDISIETFDTPIDADFLLTTQAYVDEEIILVNVSEPLGDRVAWTIPETAEIISKTDEKLILRFEAEGPYDIHLRSYQSDCYEDFSKTILVQPAIENIDAFTAQGDFIEEFIVYPNPNPGTFKTKISLAEASNITVKIVNLISGAVMNERSEKNQQEFLLNYEMSLPTGVYLMMLETPRGSETRKLVFE